MAHTDSSVCPNRRAIRPLNASAVSTANAAQPSCSNYRERKRWMDAYIAAGAQWECACPAGHAPATPVAPCPTTCTITGQTVATSPANRARTRLAVGEELRLTVTPGPATWAITSGGGSLSPSSGSHTSVTYTAGDSAGSVTITASDASGCSCTSTYTVVAPSSWTMQRRTGTNLRHTNGRPDCGWHGTMFVRPNDVNFYNIDTRERDSQCVASGSHAGFAGVWHGSYPAPARVSAWMTISMANHSTANGSRVNMIDNIYTGDPGAGATGAAPPFTAGTHHFSITMQWRIGTGAAQNFPAVRQEAEVFTNGRCEARKGGNTERTRHTDATSTP